MSQSNPKPVEGALEARIREVLRDAQLTAAHWESTDYSEGANFIAGKVLAALATAPARDGVRLELEEVCRVICYCCANPQSGYQPAKLETSGIWEGGWMHRNSADVDPMMFVHSECMANKLRQYVANLAAKEQADGA